MPSSPGGMAPSMRSYRIAPSVATVDRSREVEGVLAICPRHANGGRPGIGDEGGEARVVRLRDDVGRRRPERATDGAVGLSGAIACRNARTVRTPRRGLTCLHHGFRTAVEDGVEIPRTLAPLTRRGRVGRSIGAGEGGLALFESSVHRAAGDEPGRHDERRERDGPQRELHVRSSHSRSTMAGMGWRSWSRAFCPSSPFRLSPQQRTVPSVAIAHVDLSAVATAAVAVVPRVVTRVGT